MDRLKLFWRRLREASFKRMMTYVNEVKKDSKLPKLWIMFDMLVCSAVYNVGFYDYYIFGFAHIHGYKKRSSFFTMKDNWRLNKLVNVEGKADYFRHKDLFYNTFENHLGRKYLEINKIDLDQFMAFVKENPIFFTKQVANFGGLGVKRIDAASKDLDSKEEMGALFEELKAGNFGLIEQPLKQHEKMNELNPTSINTIRVATLIDDEGEVHVMFTFVRMGISGSFVDNSTSGGLNVLITNEDGIITKPALCDKTGVLYEEHPDTHTKFRGFQVPYFKEALALCKEQAYVVKGVRYVGWDVCITPTGPVFVEGNYLPAYDGQLYYQLDHPGYGLKPLYKKYVKDL